MAEGYAERYDKVGVYKINKKLLMFFLLKCTQENNKRNCSKII